MIQKKKTWNFFKRDIKFHNKLDHPVKLIITSDPNTFTVSEGAVSLGNSFSFSVVGERNETINTVLDIQGNTFERISNEVVYVSIATANNYSSNEDSNKWNIHTCNLKLKPRDRFTLSYLGHPTFTV
jgi:hypothetical protein